MIKRFFLLLAILLGSVGTIHAADTLYEYYAYELPSIRERAILAIEGGIVDEASQYTGTAQQNNALLRYLQNGKQSLEFMVPIAIERVQYGVYEQLFGSADIVPDGVPAIIWNETENLFGANAFRPSEFKTTLAESKTEGHSDTTLKLNSITTKDDNTLDPLILGDTIVLHVNPGASNAEIVLCTGLTVATKTFTGCTFGYRFDKNATASANIKAHAPGETVIISNDDHYLVAQYGPVDSAVTVTGAWEFSTTTQSISKLFIGDEGGYIWFNDSTKELGFASATSGTEFAWNSGGTSFTAIPPISLVGGELKLNTSTYDFSLDGTNLRIATGTVSSGTASGNRTDDYWNERWNATTTRPGTFTVSDDFAVSGNATTTGSHHFAGDLSGSFDFFGGTGTDGDLTISSGTTTVDLGSAQIFIKNYDDVSITGGGLAFSNPHANGTIVILRAKTWTHTGGNVDITSLGAAGGAGGTGSYGAGATGGENDWIFDTDQHGGGGGQGTAIGTAGRQLHATSSPVGYFNSSAQVSTVFYRGIRIVPGSGGGGGASGEDGSGNGGAGGRGAGALLIETPSYNFASPAKVLAYGADGAAGSAGAGNAGGGGGAGAMISVIYNTLIADTGTYNVAAGSGGAGGSGGSGGPGDGGGGAGSSEANGSAGSLATGNGNPGGAGGAGAAGIAFRTQNIWFYPTP